MARPTDYSQEILDKAQEYYSNLPKDENLHSIEGLSDYIGIARSTIYDWISQDDKKAFSDIVARILNKQGKTLLNKGVSGEFNSSITKVILTKHGYRDAVDTDVTTKGEKINIGDPKVIEIAKRYEEELKKEL